MDKFDDVGLYPGRYKGWMETFGGRRVNPFYVRKEDVDIIAIAHSLSLTCRYGGHCKEFYSVAEHSIRVAYIVKPEYKLAALLHDAAEAFLGDVIRPVKYDLLEHNVLILQEAEEKALKVIMDKFGVDFSEDVREAVKQADNIVGATEGRDLMYHSDTWGKLPEPLKETIRPISSKEAEAIFLFRFKLYGGTNEAKAMPRLP